MRIIILATGLVGLGSVQADQKDSVALDTAISFVTVNGSWQDGGMYGHYRLVVKKAGWEHTRSFVYLQWLRLDQDQQASEVIESMPIDEFNSEDWRYFHHASFKEGKYTINYRDRGREHLREAVLTPGVPGNYSIVIKDQPFECAWW